MQAIMSEWVLGHESFLKIIDNQREEMVMQAIMSE